MSLALHVLPGSREGQRMGDWTLIESMIVDGLFDVYNKYHMGITAENVAKKYVIRREKQDALALGSQRKAAAAQEAGRFKDEIVPYSISQKKGDPIVVDARCQRSNGKSRGSSHHRGRAAAHRQRCSQHAGLRPTRTQTPRSQASQTTSLLDLAPRLRN
jgi:hypothetical protein